MITLEELKEGTTKHEYFYDRIEKEWTRVNKRGFGNPQLWITKVEIDSSIIYTVALSFLGNTTIYNYFYNPDIDEKADANIIHLTSENLKDIHESSVIS